MVEPALEWLACMVLDCKTVRIFAYSSTREQSNGRVRLARFARVRLLRHALPISLLILRKKPTVLQSSMVLEKGKRQRHILPTGLYFTLDFAHVFPFDIKSLDV